MRALRFEEWIRLRQAVHGRKSRRHGIRGTGRHQIEISKNDESYLMSFELPPYPYDLLIPYRNLAEGHEGGVVDLSVGTPCDPPPKKYFAAFVINIEYGLIFVFPWYPKLVSQDLQERSFRLCSLEPYRVPLFNHFQVYLFPVCHPRIHLIDDVLKKLFLMFIVVESD